MKTQTSTLLRLFSPLLVAGAVFAAGTSAHAAALVDTGSPDGQAVGAYAFDGVDWYAAQVNVASTSVIDDVHAHVLGGTAGDTFHISLYAAGGTGASGAALYCATATFTADGWNGVSGFGGWLVGPGTYWVGIEDWSSDTIGMSSATGALLDQDAANPVAATAYSSASGSDWASTGTPLSIGLMVDATPVPWPAQGPLMLYGLLLIPALASSRRTRRD